MILVGEFQFKSNYRKEAWRGNIYFIKNYKMKMKCNLLQWLYPTHCPLEKKTKQNKRINDKKLQNCSIQTEFIFFIILDRFSFSEWIRVHKIEW